jgi:DNA-binding MarR family transcriptional regulator
MDSVVSESSSAQARARRRRVTAIKASLRELSNQLALLNRRVSAQVDLRDADLDCLELVARHGPLSPSTLARHAGLHPATMTGVLDRLERGGWVTRERDPGAADRRAVTVRIRTDRAAEIFRLYAGMNARMDEILARYSEAELELLADFVRRTASAGRDATEQLTGVEDTRRVSK